MISYIRDDIRALPAIRKVLEENHSAYYSGMDYVTHVSSRYNLQSPIEGVLVIPILANFLSVGYIVSEYFKMKKHFTPADFQQFNHFGEYVGRFIVKQHNPNYSKLSPREIELIEALSNGFSTKEMSYMMSLSEATIKQYIKQLLTKLNAKNRAHAVSIYLHRTMPVKH